MALLHPVVLPRTVPSLTRSAIMTTAVQFNAALLQKYDQPLPRYTSYPSATEFRADFSEHHLRQAIARSNQRQSPLSLYCHIPFCQSACYFCGCNVIVSGNKNIAVPYLDYLTREIAQTAQLIDTRRPVTQLHWGGGTPNYFTIEQVQRLWNTITTHFSIATDAEVSIEVNPRYVDREYIAALRHIGFNRISFGIQDFNPTVQAAINRIQPEEQLFNVMEWIRAAQFTSVNVDLIYGLPYQTLGTFLETIHKTIQINPDRIAVFSFAYVPWLKPVQQNIPADALPSCQEKLNILEMTIDRLTHNGFQFIGMDHFAKSTDELAIAQRNHTLHRNFQGYTTQPHTDLLAFGMTGISMLHDTYAQNLHSLNDYYKAMDANQFPLEKGIFLNQEDILRRYIINQLMCHFSLTKAEIEEAYLLNFDSYFAHELYQLQHLEQDGMVQLRRDRIDVTPTGRLLIRNIAAVFDKHLRSKKQPLFSKAI